MKPSTVRVTAVGIGSFLFLGLLLSIADRDAAGTRDISAAIVGLAVFGGIGLLAWRIRTGPRRDAARDAARTLGLGYAAGDTFDLMDLPYPLFHRVVTVRGLDNVMFGTWRGMDVTLFEYWYARSSDPSKDDVERFSCLMTPLSPTWPDLAVVPETVAARVAGRVTMREIDLESELFNRSFTVRSSDARFARALLDAQMMDWLLGLGGGWGFEIAEGTLLCYRSPQLQPWEVEQVLHTAAAFVTRIPRVVPSLFPGPVSVPE
jgi:hypothetical protein